MKDKRAGFYWQENKPFISVTNAISIIDKPALRYWYSKQCYYEVIKNPMIEEDIAITAGNRVSQQARGRGSTVHSIIEAYKQTGAVIENVPEEFKPYANAFYDWAAQARPEILEVEKTVYHTGYGYAGTLDMLARVGGKETVIDFKTSKDGTVYTEAHIQVSAYRMALGNIEQGLIVALAADGTWNQQVARDGKEAFLHCLGLYQFINREKLESLGWKGQSVWQTYQTKI